MSDALYLMVKYTLKPASKLLFDARVSGAENVPAQGPLVVASNHVSYLDPPMLGTWFPRLIHFMAKRELFDTPVLGPLIRAVHAFPVNREAGDLSAIRHALHVLKAGGVVGVFPEGRRNLDGEAQARSGAVLLAATAQCPVVPVALLGTNVAAKRLRASHVEVRIGTPMTFQGSARRPTKAELSAWTADLTQRIADLMENNADPKSANSGVLLRR
ncbi:MAG TPA: lysophospholipid acyltransferase family protein [Candidatus Eremiobacteraceae bacterium]|nr:lysophospholipid acyltransferase family protein [Candidatus Eremiobacteraceae bacterium]